MTSPCSNPRYRLSARSLQKSEKAFAQVTNLASIVIVALSNFETGQPVLAPWFTSSNSYSGTRQHLRRSYALATYTVLTFTNSLDTKRAQLAAVAGLLDAAERQARIRARRNR